VTATRGSRLAGRATRIAPSPTLILVAKAKALIAQGADVIRFDAGEPDFPTPQRIRDAAKRAMDEGKTGYTAASGMPELKQVIADKLERDNGLCYEPSQIIVSCGGKFALYVAMQALFQEGDEVLVPAPYWVSYPPMVELAGASAVIVPTTAEEGFLASAGRLAEHIGPNTRGLILNSPSNPTGAAYDEAQLGAIAELAVERGLWVLSDEIYEKMLYGGQRFAGIAAQGEAIRERTLVFNGVSKAYAMTGWRIGYAAGPGPVIKAMGAMQSQSTSNPTTISQYAAMEAMAGPQDDVAEMVAAFEERRGRVVELLEALPGVSCRMPVGAFYVLPDMGSHLGKRVGDQRIETDADLSEYLLSQHHVAVVPGSAFGAPGFQRISYACSMDAIEEGVARIARALGELEPA